jgi:MFS family permease
VKDPIPSLASARRLPGSVWALGFVSLLMDASSELIHSLLPVFLVSALGASAVTLGLIEGVAEGTASVSKLFSGWLSDRLGKRKALAVAGYGLAALSKPMFALATTAGWVFGARFADRVGKGIRGSPRDALVADITPKELRGAAFGLRQALDSVGAVLGPLLAMALMALWNDDFRRVFWAAVVPAALSVAVLMLFVREPDARAARAAVSEKPRPVLRLADLRELDRAFWVVVIVGGVLTLARFSEAFLVLRAQDLGMSVRMLPLVFVVMNAVYAGSAYPFGALSDRMSRWTLIGAGFAVLIAADLTLAYATSVLAVLIGVALWGLHMGMTQGLLSALVSVTAPAKVRGTAFGIFQLASGVALLLASLVAGQLWDAAGPRATFLAGAGITAAGLAALGVFGRRDVGEAGRA